MKNRSFCRRVIAALPSRMAAGRWVCLGMALLALTGCQSYQLQGTVLPGNQSVVLVVAKDDPRLNQRGLDGATLQMTIDPQSLSATMLPMDMTDPDGRFSIPVSQTGAGFLEYQLEVLCRAEGHAPAVRTLPLPAANKRLLIIMAAGADHYKGPSRDIVDQTIDLGRQITPGQ